MAWLKSQLDFKTIVFILGGLGFAFILYERVSVGLMQIRQHEIRLDTNERDMLRRNTLVAANEANLDNLGKTLKEMNVLLNDMKTSQEVQKTISERLERKVDQLDRKLDRKIENLD